MRNWSYPFVYIIATRFDINNSQVTLDRERNPRFGFPLIVSPAFIPLVAPRATSSRGLLFIFPERLCDACVGRATGSLRHGSSSHRFVDFAVEEDDTCSHVNRSSKWRAAGTEMKNLDKKRAPEKSWESEASAKTT